MADLKEAGCCTRRIPRPGVATRRAWRLFVNGLLEIGNLAEDERHNNESLSERAAKPVASAPKGDGGAHRACRIAPGRRRGRSRKAAKAQSAVRASRAWARARRAGYRGWYVENRVIEVPLGLPPSTLVSAPISSIRG